MRWPLVLAAVAALGVSACISTASRRADATAIFTSRGAAVRAKHYRDVGPDCANLGYATIVLVGQPRGGADQFGGF